MVASGSLWGNNVDGTEGSYLDWQRTDVTEEGNYSTIAWQVGWRFVANGCRGLRLGNCVINGVTVYNDSDGGDGVHGFVSGHNHRPKLQTASGFLNIPHNDDGTKQFSASVRMTGFSGALSQGTTIWTMDAISRIPDAPSKPSFSDVKQRSLVASFTPNGTGGLPLIQYQLAYGLTGAANDTTITSAETQPVTGLFPGRTYYFRARARNSVGWGPWSAISSVSTMAGVRVNVGGVYKRAIPYVRVAGVWKRAMTYGKIAGIWKETQ